MLHLGKLVQGLRMENAYIKCIKLHFIIKLNCFEVYVNTDAGWIRGRERKVPSVGRVEEYLGIPFAKPPVGNLRFADPEPYGMFPNG